MMPYYVVWEGHRPGIYETWGECEAQVKGYSGAKYKKFKTEKQAKEAFSSKDSSSTGSSAPPPLSSKKKPSDFIPSTVDPSTVFSVATDVGTSGNPGKMEYRVVDTETGSVLYSSPIYPVGTNNIGEFLAIVEGLKYVARNPHYTHLFTDSTTAIAWVRKQQVKTTLARGPQTETLWQAIDSACEWLKANPVKVPILKWDTKQRGEIPADYGRK